VRTILETPPIPRIVPADVFDAFGWCTSGSLEWRAPDTPALERPLARVTTTNPARMVFVMKRELSFLPRELARLHVPGLGLDAEWALAPYGIDDATDGLYARRVPPADALCLATDSVPGLFWGLHDWAHFHSHGSFEQRAWTELQCDASALAWLWLNRAKIALDAPGWAEIRDDVERIAAARFTEESLPPPDNALDARRLRSFVEPAA
jgi:hypothetical protein